MPEKKLLIMAGGTGGHVFPGLAVAKEMQAQGWAVHWLGTRTRIEARVVPEHQIPCSFIEIDGVRGKGLFGYLVLPWRLMKAVCQAKKVMKHVQPDVVIGFGGFVAAPGGLAAWLSRIPLLIHEQNAVMGLTNRILSRFARRILLGFSSTVIERAASEKASVVGNPVRPDITQIADVQRQERSGSLRVLVIGGSLGARVFNQTVPLCHHALQNSIEIWHQTGRNHAEQVKTLYQDSKADTVRVEEFIDDMAKAYAWADVVLCRAGALTVTELIAAQKPAILIPFPYAVDDHQTKNAEFTVQKGGAVLLPESEFTVEKTVELLQSLHLQRQKLDDMHTALAAMMPPNATTQVASICEHEYQQGKSI